MATNEHETILYRELSYDVVGAAMAVHKELGHGFLEKVYHNALAVELRNRGVPFEMEAPIKVSYKDEEVGDYYADFIIEGKRILEIKACNGICDEHMAQVINYIKATGLRLGILMNFGAPKFQFKRVVL
jgi:GxxExxY protein